MDLLKDYPLKSLNTFNISVDGKFFTEVASIGAIKECWQFSEAQGIPLLVLGGGSNLLFTGDFRGMVMKVNIGGKEVIRESGDHYFVRAGAGENWDQFVAFCVTGGYAGLENLSLIPGSVGAGPVQNIGAYGVELKDRLESLEFYHFRSGEVSHMKAGDCRFGYRDSIFKQELKGEGVVMSAVFRLNKKPEYEISYGSVREELEKGGAPEVSPAAIREAVIRIRRSKLPDPEVIGNGGSFFKNPTVGVGEHDLLKKKHPGLVSFKQPAGTFKLAAGWLIDQCGWKGFRRGDAGVHDRQALVLVNHGNASGEDIFRLSEEIRESVMNKFGVSLEREVNVI